MNRHRLLLLVGWLLPVLASCTDVPLVPAGEAPVDLASSWEVVEPEAVGLNSLALFVASRRAAATPRMRSLIVARRGRIALERYYGDTDRQTLLDVRSVTKSVVTTLVGVALERGDIQSLDQPITDFLSDAEYDLRPEHANVTIRHLLTMGGGFAWSEAGGAGYIGWRLGGNHVNALLALPFEADPGATFRYNSPAVHVLGVVLEEAVGKSLPEYADEVLFGPLGIGERGWEQLSAEHVNGGAGVRLRSRDLARLGQLYLQDGLSGTDEIVPSGWIEEATTAHWPRLGSAGPIPDVTYGYLWWIDEANDAFFAWGWGGQFVYVVPRLELVVVATTQWETIPIEVGPSELQNLVLEVIVEGILPAAR